MTKLFNGALIGLMTYVFLRALWEMIKYEFRICWPHKWTKWSSYLTNNAGYYNPQLRQQRRCLNCGKDQDVLVADNAKLGTEVVLMREDENGTN